MALTARQTVAMFMRYVRTEDDPVREAAELVAKRRQAVVMGKQSMAQKWGYNRLSLAIIRGNHLVDFNVW